MQTADVATILLVEDDAPVRMVAESILTDARYQVLEASSAVDAMRLVERHGREIDLLLTDVFLPHVSGEELAVQVRALLPGVRVLFMSGLTRGLLQGRGKLRDGATFLDKPFTPGTLIAKVREALAGGAHAA